VVSIRPLLSFVKEREAIRLKKLEGLPAPWTKDQIFQIYRFCNIRRADDRVSAWLIKHVLTEKNVEYDLRSFLMFSAWCRWVNWPPTIAAVMKEGFYPKKRIDWQKLGRFVDKIKGKKWTGAYMIVAPRKVKQKKGVFVARTVIQKSFGGVLPSLIELLEGGVPSFEVGPHQATREQVWALLKTRNFFGGFMAGQIVADWGYTSLLRHAPDANTWAAPGPGSSRGFNRLLGLPIKTKIDPELWKAKLPEWREKVIKLLGSEYADLTAMDVQNQLCELDKYLRVKTGAGRPRAKYRPETAYA
jgi:hypothetical protein